MSGEDSWDILTDGGLFVLNSIQNGRSTAYTPSKSIPVGLLESHESVLSQTKNVIETVQEVNSVKLHAAAGESKSLIDQGMEDKLSHLDGDEIKFCFWIYTDTFPISELDARMIVKLSEEYSDVITPPLQHGLLRAILYENEEALVNTSDEEVEDPANPDLLRLYRIGVERFLEAASDSNKMSMAPIPFLVDNIEFMTDLITDYESYQSGLNALCFNFLRKKPTSPPNRDALGELVGHMRRLGYFNPTLKYAINIRHSYPEEGNVRSAEDLALACMGFDIVGENHWRPPNYSGDFEVNFRGFERDALIYREVPNPKNQLRQFWPEKTAMDVNDVLNAQRDRELRRLEKLFNAEQIELTMSELREDIELGKTRDFVNSHPGTRSMRDTFTVIANTYDDPSVQSSVGDF